MMLPAMTTSERQRVNHRQAHTSAYAILTCTVFRMSALTSVWQVPIIAWAAGTASTSTISIFIFVAKSARTGQPMRANLPCSTMPLTFVYTPIHIYGNANSGPLKAPTQGHCRRSRAAQAAPSASPCTNLVTPCASLGKAPPEREPIGHARSNNVLLEPR